MADNSLNNKRIAKNTILLYIRSFLLLLIGLYTSRLTLQVLGVEDYGIYQVVGGVVTMFSMLSSTLNAASQRFITYALGTENNNEVKLVFSTCMTLHIILGFIAVFILEILGVWFLSTKLNIPPDRLQAATYVMHISIATFFINVISVPYNSVIIAHERMGAFAYISLLDGVLRLICVSLLFFINWDKLVLYAVFYFVVGLICRSIYSIYCTNHFEETRSIKLYIEKDLFGKMFSFAGWNLLGSSALVLRNQGIDVLLNMFFGVSVNAAKGVSNQIQTAVHQLVGNFTTSVNPQLTKSIAQKDFARTHSLIFHGGKMAFSLMMIIAVPFIINCNAIMSIWLKEVPEYAVEFAILSFIYLLTDTQSRFLINSILANGKIRTFQITLGGVKLFAVPLTWVLLKLGGSPMVGIIVNIILQFTCLFGELQFAHKYVLLRRKNYLIKIVLKCWLTFICALGLSFLFYKFGTSNIILSGIVSEIITLAALWQLNLDSVEKNMLKDLLFKKVLKRI